MNLNDLKNIKEGLVVVEGITNDGNVLFYNPPQVFNRDLSLVALKTFINVSRRTYKNIVQDIGKEFGEYVGINILEMLAATGIRGIRYIKELDDNCVNVAYINDLDHNAADSIVFNAQLNNIPPSKYRAICCDANMLAHILTPPADVLRLMSMNYAIHNIPCGYKPLKPFSIMDEYNAKVDAMLDLFAKSPRMNDSLYRNVIDVIDIDPYSSATGYLDSAIKCIRSGGLLMVTSTDMPTLCGNNPLVSFYKYGGSSIKAPFCHEMALRTLLYSISSTAARYQRVAEPLLSCSADFYVRVFVRITSNTIECKRLSSNSALVFMCCQCYAYNFLRLGVYTHPKQKPASFPSNFTGTCEECGGRIKIGGPIYVGKLHEKSFVGACLDVAEDSVNSLSGITTQTKIVGILTSILEELNDAPLYYKIPVLCKKWKLSTISPVIFKAALERLGYKASHFHRDPQSLKTDAPAKVVMDIIRVHAQNELKTNDHPFFKTVITTNDIDLSPPTEVHKSNVPRWLSNPSFWGPKKMHRAAASSFKNGLNGSN